MRPWDQKLETRTEPRSKNSDGFSLVELLIVVALIGLIGILVVPGIGNVFKVSMNSATREIAGKVKETYNATMMSKKVHRIVFDLKEQVFWVETGPANLLMETEESREKAKRAEKLGSIKAEEELQKKESLFSQAKLITRKKISLPRGVEIEDIATEQSPEPIKEGRALVHIFPNGIIEQTIIHLKDNSNHKSTLVIQPLVGKTKVYERYITKEEALGEDGLKGSQGTRSTGGRR